MVTCKFCGQELKFLGEKENEHYFECTFCVMTFLLSETSSNRKRICSVPEYINTLSFYSTTQEFLECDTINLYHTLKEIRAFWFSLKSLLEGAKVNLREGQLPDIHDKKSQLDQQLKELIKEYIIITKKKFVIENILLERTGFLPEKLTEEFLNGIYTAGKIASDKPMYAYIK